LSCIIAIVTAPAHLPILVTDERAREQAAANNPIKVDEDDETGRNVDGITFDDTSEFVRAITYNPVAVKPEPAEPSSTRGPSKQPSPTRDVSMDGSEEILEELEAGELVVKDEEDEEAILNAIESALKATEAEEGAVAQSEDVGTSTEQTYTSGMASTLNILRQQGILATPSADQKEREKTQLQRDLWLADQRRRLALREMERLQSRGSNKDQAQREYENRLREQQEARDNLEAFKNYKPDVNIVYYDEFGRTLTPKEAWKALSHTFHGKGSGKMKTEKRLKKIAEEKKQAAMASGDTPLSMNRAFQIRQEKAGQAHFVLSVGNRGCVLSSLSTALLNSLHSSAVPQAAEFLDAQPLSKGKTEKTKSKKKDIAKVNQTLDTGFITLPAPQSIPHTDGSVAPPSFSPVPGTTASSPVLAPRPGFSRISSAAEPSSQGGTPVPSDRTKVAFGFGAKRKAGEEIKGSPPPKKR
jgi:U4/U6.U5 tri-snRNP-associated protein 1